MVKGGWSFRLWGQRSQHDIPDQRRKLSMGRCEHSYLAEDEHENWQSPLKELHHKQERKLEEEHWCACVEEKLKRKADRTTGWRWFIIEVGDSIRGRRWVWRIPDWTLPAAWAVSCERRRGKGEGRVRRPRGQGPREESGTKRVGGQNGAFGAYPEWLSYLGESWRVILIGKVTSTAVMKYVPWDIT